jgi:putative transposase
MSTTYPSDLTDAEWECVQHFLPSTSARGRPGIHSLRRILDAGFYVLRTGCLWRLLPKDLPAWQTVYYDFRAWRLDGTWEHIHTALRKQLRALPKTRYDVEHERAREAAQGGE